MKNCNSQSIDWHRLSTVEFASALEVYGIARQFDNQPNIQKAILEHTLDEYRHAELFAEIARMQSVHFDAQISIHKLIEWGGVSADNAKDPALIASIVLFLQGEKRAETFLRRLKQSTSNAEYREKIDSVLEDELGHVSGIESFLKYHGLFDVFRHKIILSINFFTRKIFRDNKLEYLRKRAFGFLIKIILRFPIEKFALKEETAVRSLTKSIENAGRMS